MTKLLNPMLLNAVCASMYLVHTTLLVHMVVLIQLSAFSVSQ